MSFVFDRIKTIFYLTLLFSPLFSTTAFSNTFTAQVPSSASAVMGTGSAQVPLTVIHTGTDLPIYYIRVILDPNLYCASNASVAPSGWNVRAVCNNGNSFIDFSTTTDPIPPGGSKVFVLLLQGPGYGLIPKDNADVWDAPSNILAWSLVGWRWVRLTYQGALPTWIRRSFQASLFLSPSSAGVGDHVFLQLYVKNNSLSTQTFVVPSTPIPGGSGSASPISGPYPAGVTLAPDEDVIFNWDFQATSPGDLYYTVQATNGVASSDPVRSNTILIGNFTAVLDLNPLKAIDGWNVYLNLTVQNNTDSTLGDIRPGDLIFSGTAFPTYVSGPDPSVIPSISPGSSGTFQWVYRVNGAQGDTFSFATRATAFVQGISTNMAVSPQGEIVSYALEITPSSVPTGSTNVDLYFTFYNNGSNPVDRVYILVDYTGWAYLPGSGAGDLDGCNWSASDLGSGWVRFSSPSPSCDIQPGSSGRFVVTFSSVPSVNADTIYTMTGDLRDRVTRQYVVLKDQVVVTAYSLSLTSVPSGPLPADGTSYYTITATLTRGGNPVAGAVVNFTADFGTLSSSTSTTDSNGKAQVRLYAPASSVDVISTVTASYLSASDSIQLLFTGVSAPNLQYVGGTLTPRYGVKGEPASFSLEVYNAGTTSMTLTTDSTFSFSDGSLSYVSYLTSIAVVAPGNYAWLSFSSENVPPAMASGGYFPVLDFTDGSTNQVRNVSDKVRVTSRPVISYAGRASGSGDVWFTVNSDPGDVLEILYKDSFTGPWSVALTYTMSSTWYTFIDDGSLTGAHPGAVNERYYRVRVFALPVLSREEAGSFTLNVIGGLNLASFPLQLTVTRPEDIFQDQLVGDTSELYADRILVWDRASASYRYAWKFDSGGAFPAWDGKWIETALGGETTITIGGTDGFFIQSRHGAQRVQVVGFVPTSSLTKSIGFGLQMVGWPYPAQVTLGASGLWESGAHGDTSELYADRVWFWDRGTQSFRYAWLFDSGGAFPDWDGKWIETALGGETTITLIPGYGYFFQDRLNDFTWVYPKPYTEP